MQAISQLDHSNKDSGVNGHADTNDNMTGRTSPSPVNHHHPQEHKTRDADNDNDVVLPVEMACMVSLRALVGKMVQKAYAELMTLTDTLPSMPDIERKRQILQYATFVRKQFLKLYVLVKWADNADDVQMCQNIMAFLANQNLIFQNTVDYLHKIHAELPAARVRNFDILTAVDVLTTGTYQRMPTKNQDMIPPAKLTDQEVLETFKAMNDVIRVRMLTSEVLPSPMHHYRIENGRIYFRIENEFEVSLTLMGPSDNRRWWIVSLDVLVHPVEGGGAAGVDISLNDAQKQRLRNNAQTQLVPPAVTTADQSSSEVSDVTKAPIFFPLVSLYDYLHLFCLNMQLEILFMQSTMLSKNQWADQLKVHMDATRTKLTLVYWGGGSAAAQWACPQYNDVDSQQSTVITIYISNEDDKSRGGASSASSSVVTVRDELKGLIQKAGVGASVALADVDANDKPKVASALKYPKASLDILWGGSSDLHSDSELLVASCLNVERLFAHITTYHAHCIIEKFRELLLSQHSFLKANGLCLVENASNKPEAHENDAADNVKAATAKRDTTILNGNKRSSLTIRYRHERYIRIDLDTRTGHIQVCAAEYGSGEGDAKLKGLEERLNNDPSNIAKHLLWFRSEIIIREIISLAKQLSLQPYYPAQMNLRPDDVAKLFADIPSSASTTEFVSNPGTRPGTRESTPNTPKSLYPPHCLFLQFSQFEDWYFVITITKNEFQAWMCCLSKNYDANGVFQTIADIISIDHEQLWKEQFQKRTLTLDQMEKKRRHPLQDKSPETTNESTMNNTMKRRKTLDSNTSFKTIDHHSTTMDVDNLSIDLRFMAKMDSLCRAYITNKKIEFQLLRFKKQISYRKRPFLKTLSLVEAQALNHPAADKMEVICVPNGDLLRACTYHNSEGNGVNPPAKDKPIDVWVEKIARHMKKEVVMRPSGWWTSGRNKCFVVIQDKCDLTNIKLRSCKITDHISVDKSTGVLSFNYPEVSTCIETFLLDWERIFMMANLARQVSSLWFRKYKDILEFEPFDMQELKFTYAKYFKCSIRWDVQGNDRPRRYIVELGKKRLTEDQTKQVNLPDYENPHILVATFLQGILNDKRDLIYFVQVSR
ncbi:mediator complex subunit MED14-domain-containing protein [Radiomyces spectabilis]|uniref:mediator complex subunit MED14-domain-containing protein n=1 Tax=Radiomyces spectabilis TaxID=64574 RepID=UPI0022203EEA|nr:mediator complex subunit MED14-domain-containing protein [Radiomyces spectabilis]KAI8372823.1 mediator complex subunit MED14-domain-containing protein [Radiomyces spectabilis]